VMVDRSKLKVENQERTQTALLSRSYVDVPFPITQMILQLRNSKDTVSLYNRRRT